MTDWQRKRWRPPACETLECRRLLAAGPDLLADINVGTLGAEPASMTAVGSTLFFTATDAHGRELWRTDGTTAGTLLVKDLRPGWRSAEPAALVELNGVLYFTAEDETSGRELWRSDGTTAGTQRVKDIWSGETSSGIEQLIVSNGQLFFVADDGIHGRELWKSDGSEAGTQLVTEIRTDTYPAISGELVAHQGVVYFSGLDINGGRELWKSDGTPLGTVRVKDIRLGSASATPRDLLAAGNFLYFTAEDEQGRALWRTDGTESATLRLVDLSPGTQDLPFDYPSLAAIQGLVYFVADDGQHGREVWLTDGSIAGTRLLKDIVPGPTSSAPQGLKSVAGTLFFSAVPQGSGSVVSWRSDGTGAGTVPSTISDLGSLIAWNGRLYFSEADGPTGIELWSSNFAEGARQRVADIQPGAGSSFPRSLSVALGALYLVADNGVLGAQLWQTDGTEQGTVLVKNIVGKTAPSYPRHLTDVAGTLYFAANTEPNNAVGAESPELWRSTGTSASTSLVRRFRGDLVGLTAVGKTLFFFESQAAPVGSQLTLWRSEGTSATTVRIRQWNEVQFFSELNVVASSNGLFFGLNDGQSGTELWTSDGTPAGTKLVRDMAAGPGSSSPYNLYPVGGTLYFNAIDESGVGLWKSDGTEAGTELVQAGTGWSGFQKQAALGDWLLFAAQPNPVGPLELWRSDGTGAGTERVRSLDLRNSGGVLEEATFVVANGLLFFSATDDKGDRELWKSDGTALGTARLKNINAVGSSYPAVLTPMSGLLYFAATDELQNLGLWKTDGTEAGTQLVKSLSGDGICRNVQEMTAVADTLYISLGYCDGRLIASDLWQSDGTASGTLRVFERLSTYRQGLDLTAAGGTLFFGHDDGIHGRELWYLRPDLKGDFDHDDDVDSADMLVFLENWTGALEPDTGGHTADTGDLDGDGDVDSVDLLALLSHWTGARNFATSSTAIGELTSTSAAAEGSPISAEFQLDLSPLDVDQLFVMRSI